MDGQIEANLSILPPEKLIEILLALNDLEDIFKACSSSTIFARVCQDDYFWKLRYQQDFGTGRPSEEITLKPSITTGSDTMPWREFYQLIFESSLALPLSAGLGHIGVIDRKGRLNMWGRNLEGQLGDGTTISTNLPQIVLHDVLQVSCGSYTTGAVTKNGKVYTWGYNSLGGSTMSNVSVPRLIKLSKKVRKINLSSRGGSSIVLTEEGEVYVWGMLNEGLRTEVPVKLDLPRRDASPSVRGGSIVVDLPIGDNKVIDIAAGYHVFAAITQSEKLYMWGDNINYLYLSQNWEYLVEGIYNPDHPGHRKFTQPTLVPFLKPIRQISMGENHFGVVTRNGELWMAGNNDLHQIGEYTSDEKEAEVVNKLLEEAGQFWDGISIPTLILIKLPSPVLYFNSRWETSLVKLRDGRVLMWGNNTQGQIDSYGYKRLTRSIDTTPDVGDIIEPVEIILDQPIVHIVVGGKFTVAITGDDYINLWGEISHLYLN